jgi:hypothetical protein
VPARPARRRSTRARFGGAGRRIGLEGAPGPGAPVYGPAFTSNKWNKFGKTKDLVMGVRVPRVGRAERGGWRAASGRRGPPGPCVFPSRRRERGGASREDFSGVFPGFAEGHTNLGMRVLGSGAPPLSSQAFYATPGGARLAYEAPVRARTPRGEVWAHFGLFPKIWKLFDGQDGPEM